MLIVRRIAERRTNHRRGETTDCVRRLRKNFGMRERVRQRALPPADSPPIARAGAARQGAIIRVNVIDEVFPNISPQRLPSLSGGGAWLIQYDPSPPAGLSLPEGITTIMAARDRCE